MTRMPPPGALPESVRGQGLTCGECRALNGLSRTRCWRCDRVLEAVPQIDPRLLFPPEGAAPAAPSAPSDDAAPAPAAGAAPVQDASAARPARRHAPPAQPRRPAAPGHAAAARREGGGRGWLIAAVALGAIALEAAGYYYDAQVDTREAPPPAAYGKAPPAAGLQPAALEARPGDDGSPDAREAAALLRDERELPGREVQAPAGRGDDPLAGPFEPPPAPRTVAEAWPAAASAIAAAQALQREGARPAPPAAARPACTEAVAALALCGADIAPRAGQP